MGRRSRKRASQGAPRPRPEPDAGTRPPQTAARSRSRRPRRDERPPAPWGSFPLVELCVALALVIGVAGFFTGGTRGATMLAAAAGLGSLAGLELSLREHLAGYKSHSTVLSGAVAVAVLAGLVLAGVPRGITLVAAAVVFGSMLYLLREVFKRRSGGHGFR